jgi:excisionase family DNA binding protein
MEPLLIQANGLSKMLGIPVRAIYRLAFLYKIPFVKPGRNIFFSRERIKEWIVKLEADSVLEMKKWHLRKCSVCDKPFEGRPWERKNTCNACSSELQVNGLNHDLTKAKVTLRRLKKSIKEKTTP